MSRPPDSTHDVTRLLQAWEAGDALAADALLPLIYEHLRALARDLMRRERPDHTLQPTALVHEAYLRLTEGAPVNWQGRGHFYRLAARAMRRLLVDHARARQALRRGGPGQRRVPLGETALLAAADPAAGDGETDLVALDAALVRLADEHPRPAEVVELRFFGGIELEEVATALGVSERTVKRDWQFARLWLHRALGLPPDAA